MSDDESDYWQWTQQMGPPFGPNQVLRIPAGELGDLAGLFDGGDAIATPFYPHDEGEVMDPNAALQEIRELLADPVPADSGLWGSRLGRLAELVDGLDGWLSKGGFLPDAWTNGGPRV